MTINSFFIGKENFLMDFFEFFPDLPDGHVQKNIMPSFVASLFPWKEIEFICFSATAGRNQMMEVAIPELIAINFLECSLTPSFGKCQTEPLCQWTV